VRSDAKNDGAVRCPPRVALIVRRIEHVLEITAIWRDGGEVARAALKNPEQNSLTVGRELGVVNLHTLIPLEQQRPILTLVIGPDDRVRSVGVDNGHNPLAIGRVAGL